MEPNQLLKAELIDIVFEDRNKEYGAYELRTHYPQRIGRAMFVTFALCTALLAAATYSPKNTADRKLEGTLVILKPAPAPEEKPVIPPAIPPASQPPVATIANPPIRIVRDEVATDMVPTQEDFVNARIDLTTSEGVADEELSVSQTAVKEGTRIGVIELRQKEDPKIETTVDVQAEFKGNWSRFLTNNLRANTPIDNGVAQGRYAVMVEFVVDIDGNVSQIKPLTNIGYGMEEEAVRVIKKSAKWTPAVNRGYPVKAYRRQSIIFEVSGAE